ncbi:Helicase conserved C-terminal domain-containing protein [Nonlabens sp. Hel1_33_55]|uniref:DEAD/DEAH box helicase n=1 Tax=Nonlabens sp. Hel1_33_55 TaxID=1336802 RepID=UPI000875B9C5|nr:DEAD/DEAH box helicase [Nonlabens sp. Hel1_33_55]SCY36736.1 Helicase conserved C-terminal domain-containing protein [Nonlabens sp. Hel1_33_55]
MLSSEKSTFTALVKGNTFFKEVISKLTLDQDLSEVEKSYILSCALIFLDRYNNDRRNKSFADFAYYIVLKYSLNFQDYKPLYDFSVEFGFFPITDTILKNNLIGETSFRDFVVGLKLLDYEKVVDAHSKYVETFEQNTERIQFVHDNSQEKSFLAPTSFGKSSVIVEYISSLEQKQKIAIIVPTKSLLMQTYKMIRDANLGYRVLMHNEMYKDEDNFIAIFTQERALRLLKSAAIAYDSLIIDEAHNIFKKDNRSLLLARLIRLNKNRKESCKIVYLSPLIDTVNSLKINSEQEINSHTINFNIKSPEIFEFSLENKLLKHNRFFINDNNTGLFLSNFENHFDLIQKTSKSKNFLYNYRPVHIEDLAKNLAGIVNDKENNYLKEIIAILKDEVHEKFYCVPLLKKGIIYLHGKLPDLIKEYLEKKFKEIHDINYVVANSVILEGMNLPVDNLYIFNTRGLGGKELTNLIGRVNRLNEIFKKGNNLAKLLPSVYFVNNKLYNMHGNNALKMFNKIKLLRNRTFSDIIDNPVLNKFDIESIKDSDKDAQQKKRDKVIKLIEYEDFLIKENLTPEEILKQYFIENSFSIFYNDLDFLVDKILQSINNLIYLSPDWNSKNILDKIFTVFIKDFADKDNFIIDYEFFRLNEESARNYYHTHIENRKKSLKENIQIVFNYLKSRKNSENSEDHIYYIGTTYGEQTYQSNKYFNELNNSKVAINLKVKNDEELVNYAIVKLKIEDDFISFKLNKLIVFLYDFNFISKDEYNEYVYGTTNEEKIELTKFGLTIGLIDRLTKDKQLTNLKFDENNNLTSNENFQEYLKTLNDFQRFEIERFLS